MGKRIRGTAAAVVVAVVASGVVALTGSAPAAAAPQPFTLDLVEGQLLVDDAEEPYALGQPTSIGGQHDTGDGGTGAVTGGTFTSPAISFETEALGQPVFVDATFSQISPGSANGSIDAEGNVAFRTELRVDLHIEVDDPPILVQECRAEPVSIALDSTAPYDAETGRVTVVDPDFTVPAVPVTDTCISLVAGNVNELLAGSGHSLTMTLEGDLEPPPPAGCPTTTELTAPERSLLGDEVALDVAVVAAPDGSPACADAGGVVPAGSVEVRADDEVIGVADLGPTGTAQIATDDLPTGPVVLTARYRGQPPYAASTSAPVAHTVAPRPAIEADVPPAFVIGAAPAEVEVTISNSGIGTGVVNARLDATFRRTDAITGVVPGELSVERLVGDTWVPVTLGGGFTPAAALMEPAGVPLAPGEVLTQRLRIAATDAATPKAISITFEVVAVDPTTGEPAPQASPAPAAVASATVASAFVEDERRPTTLALEALSPHTLRRGMTARADVQVQTEPGGPTPTGTYEVLLDGERVPVRSDRTPPELGYQDTITIGTIEGATFPELVVPPDHPTGVRQVTIRYSGDDFYGPSQVTRPLVVLADRGPTYDCINSNLFFADRFTVNVDAYARVPAAAVPGMPRPLPQLDVEVYADRGDAVNSYGSLFGPTTPVVEPGSTDDGIVDLDLGFGSLGTGTATAMTLANNVSMGPDTLPEDPDPDMVLGFEGETAALTVSGAPGDVVPVDLDEIHIDARVFGGFPFELTCTPLAEPERLGSIVVAGTTLTVEAPDPTREGDDVTLRAQVAPAGVPGTVELLDGDEAIGVATVGSDGTASLTTDDLAAGTHTLRARFRTASAALRSTSEPVELVVLEAAQCPPAPASAHGATVRLMYLTLLGRCPTADEAAYWVGRLGAGATQASVARSIATGPEGVGELVEAGYEMVLDREADAAGKAYWVGRLRSGFRHDRFLAALAGSRELSAAAGDDEAFVTLLYQRLLGRDPEPAGLAHWLAVLDGGAPRWRVALSVARTQELRVRLVTAVYATVLDRAPTAAELAEATARFRADGDLAALHGRLAGTPELAERAQDLPNPSDP